MNVPLIRRSDEAEAKRERRYSTVKTTPESIVRRWRSQEARRGPVQQSYIFTPKRPRIPWHQKINWEFAGQAASAGCAIAIGAVVMYLAIFHVIPFLGALRWQ